MTVEMFIAMLKNRIKSTGTGLKATIKLSDKTEMKCKIMGVYYNDVKQNWELITVPPIPSPKISMDSLVPLDSDDFDVTGHAR